jgi:hypothetical protein
MTPYVAPQEKPQQGAGPGQKHRVGGAQENGGEAAIKGMEETLKSAAPQAQEPERGHSTQVTARAAGPKVSRTSSAYVRSTNGPTDMEEAPLIFTSSDLRRSVMRTKARSEIPHSARNSVLAILTVSQ